MSKNVKDLNIGDKVKFGKHQVANETPWDITWVVVDKFIDPSDTFNANEYLTLATERIIDLRCMDPSTNRASIGGGWALSAWLGASGVGWADKLTYPPNTPAVCGGYATQYAYRPGFLTNFTSPEKGTLGFPVHHAFYFKNMRLMEYSEVDGAYPIPYFSSPDNLKVSLAPQAYANTGSSSKPSNVNGTWQWYLRSAVRNDSGDGYDGYWAISPNGDTTQIKGWLGNTGIRLICAVNNSALFTETKDSDGCYAFENILKIYYLRSSFATEGIFLEWEPKHHFGLSPDYDVRYKSILQRSLDSGEYTTIYTSSLIPNDERERYTDNLSQTKWRTVRYRVKGAYEGCDFGEYYEGMELVNSAPGKPILAELPESIPSGAQFTVSWSAPADGQKETLTYELQRSIDEGEYTTVYTGAELSFADSIGLWETVSWRVRAGDFSENFSEYDTSPTRPIYYNQAPVISGSDIDLGVVTLPPSTTFSVDDQDAEDEITVAKKVDDVAVDTIENVVRNQSYDWAMTGHQFVKLGDGSHAMKIVASDSEGNSATRIIAFRRLIDSIEFRLTPIPTGSKAQKILISMRYEAADVTIKVCNNANDTSPAWETAENGLKHVFANDTKTAANWAIGVWVTLNISASCPHIYCYSLSGSYSVSAENNKNGTTSVVLSDNVISDAQLIASNTPDGVLIIRPEVE